MKTYTILTVVGAGAVAAVLFTSQARGAGQTVATAKLEKAPSGGGGPVFEPREEKEAPKEPKPKCPVPEPKQIPEKLKTVFAKDVKDEQKVQALNLLGREERIDDCVDPLRWLVHQNETPLEVRDEGTATLVRWDVFGIQNDLSAMMDDAAQKGPWRAKCVFHLAMIYNSNANKDALLAVEKAMGSDDTFLRDEATAAAAFLARSYTWDRTAKPKYDKTLGLIEKQFGEPRKEAVTKALQAVSILTLKNFAPNIEKLIADEKQEMDVRVEAAKTLCAIARPESLAVLEPACKSPNAALAEAAKTARGFALTEQLVSGDAAAKEKAYNELAQLGLAAVPSLEPVIMSDATEEVREYARTILGDALLAKNTLPLADRTKLKKYGEEEGKPGSGNKNVLLDIEKKTIVFEAENLLQRGALEYAVVCKGENAKTHESILGLECSPNDVVYALLACNYTYAGELRANGKINLPKGAGVMMSMEYERVRKTPKGEEKKTIRVPLELMIWNAKGAHAMKRVPWAFTGSRFQKMPDGTQVLMAQIEKSVVAIMGDPNAILNTVLDAAENANVNPQQGAFYVVNPMLTPKKGAKASLIFEPWTGENLAGTEIKDDGKEAEAVTQKPESAPEKKE